MSTTIVILISSLALGQQPPQFSVSRGYVVKRGELPPKLTPPVPDKPAPMPALPKVEVKPRASMTYEEARARSLETIRPLVIGVGCNPPSNGASVTWDSIRVNELSGYQAPCIVVTAPMGGELMWVATLHSESSQFEVHQRLRAWIMAPSPEERQGILPKNRDRWNPYNQPDYQGRMRRREVSVVRPFSPRSGFVFGGSRTVTRSRSSNC